VAKFSGNRHALDLLLDRGDIFGLRPASASLLLPVPPGRARLISRDLSIPDILAHRLSSGGVPVCLKGLRRTGKVSQKGRTRQERREAFFSPHFHLDPEAFSGLPPRGVVIVDDLLVTGWTARAIVRLLALAGVEAGTIVTLLHRS
jgi:predicted amidophosphoribosyltransferase